MRTQRTHTSRRRRSRTEAALIGTLFAASALVTQPAAADEAESQRAKLVRQLEQRYGETSSAAGIADSGGVVELLTAGDGSTWTMLLTLPDGTTRIVATGESWTAIGALPGQPI